MYHDELVKAHEKFMLLSKAVPDTPNLCYSGCFKNLMNLLCCHIFPRCNLIFSSGQCVLLVISASLMEILGVLSFFHRNRNIILLDFCFKLKEQLFVSFTKNHPGNQQVVIGNSLFVTEVLAFSISMLIQHK